MNHMSKGQMKRKRKNERDKHQSAKYTLLIDRKKNTNQFLSISCEKTDSRKSINFFCFFKEILILN